MYIRYKDIHLVMYKKWTGQVARMFDNRVPKRTAEASPLGRIPAGKQKSGWEDEVRNETAILFNMKNSRAAAKRSSECSQKTGEDIWCASKIFERGTGLTEATHNLSNTVKSVLQKLSHKCKCKVALFCNCMYILHTNTYNYMIHDSLS